MKNLFLTLFVLTIASSIFSQQNNESLKFSPKSDVFMQGFYWNSPPGGIWYDSLSKVAARLASAGFSAIWFPSPSKGAGGGFSMGYDPYDHYDFGEFNQKGSRETRFGSKNELTNAINSFHNVGMEVFADAVLRHMMGGEVAEAYECIPIHNGYPIVPDSAYLVFNYPNGSGRFQKNASSFYPNSDNCWVDPLFVQTDPIFRFGEWLDHNKQSIKDSLVQWGSYLRNVLGFDGFRLDAVKSVDPAFMAYWLNNSNSNGYAVAELWGSISEIGNWLNIAKNIHGASVSMFDFPLRYELKFLCNNTSGSYDMNNLDNAGLLNAGISGLDVATFVENHDFDRIGWDDSIDTGHDPVISNKDLAYSYIMFSEGRPTVFFKDYFDYGFSGKIDTLIWIRQNFIWGSTTKRNGLNPWYVGGSGSQNEQSRDIYVARRNGGSGKPEVFLVMNDHPTDWLGVWVNSNHPNQVFRDYTGKAIDKTSAADGRVELWAPPRGYAVYVPDTTQSVSFPPVIQKVPDQTVYTNSYFEFNLSISNAGMQTFQLSLSGNPSWMNYSNEGKIFGTPAIGDTGISNVIITIMNNSNLSDKDTFSIAVVKNLPPVINSIGDTTIKATKRYEFQAVAEDPDNDSLNFFFSSAPNWLNVEALSGLITGTPSLGDTGIFSIVLKVTDYKGAFDSTSYILSVQEITDTLIATYGKPLIDGNINVGQGDWLEDWLVMADSDTDSYWRPRDSLGVPLDSLNNELLAIFSTWDADSLYFGIDYIINDTYNTMMFYIDAGLDGGVTNFNSNQGYNGDYAKNFRFKQEDGIDYFSAVYNLEQPSFFKVSGNSSENISSFVNARRGNNSRGAELAVAWNDIYGLGAGLLPSGVELKFVALIAGGFNWGAGDSAPDNPDINGDSGPDSLILLASILPDVNEDGIPDPTIYISSTQESRTGQIPDSYRLLQNYPNPFNPSTIINYQIPDDGYITIKVFDILGNEIVTLVNEWQIAGNYSITFDMVRSSKPLASGVYFYQLRAGSFIDTKKMMVIK